jgi:hypothetical protein
VHKGIDEMCEGTRSHQPLHVTTTVNKLGEWMEGCGVVIRMGRRISDHQERCNPRETDMRVVETRSASALLLQKYCYHDG